MIKTEKEYTEAKKRLAEEFCSIERQQNKMRKAGMSEEHIGLALDPLASFAHQLREEVDEYERIKRGDFYTLENLEGIGRALIAVRIAKGMKQKELASKLGIKETQVSRYERNEYHGASIEKIQKVLVALEVSIKSNIKISFKDAV